VRLQFFPEDFGGVRVLPSFCLTQPEPWTIGFVSNNIWSFAGNEQRRHVNQFMANWWANYNMAHGWYLNHFPNGHLGLALPRPTIDGSCTFGGSLRK